MRSNERTRIQMREFRVIKTQRSAFDHVNFVSLVEFRLGVEVRFIFPTFPIVDSTDWAAAEAGGARANAVEGFVRCRHYFHCNCKAY